MTHCFPHAALSLFARAQTQELPADKRWSKGDGESKQASKKKECKELNSGGYTANKKYLPSHH